MITKPEDAKPWHGELTRTTIKPNGAVVYGRHTNTNWFTAAECAEIAKAYAQASALWRNSDTIPERRTLSVEVDAWLSKFAEWEKTK